MRIDERKMSIETNDYSAKMLDARYGRCICDATTLTLIIIIINLYTIFTFIFY